MAYQRHERHYRDQTEGVGKTELNTEGRYFVATNMTHHACYRWKSPKSKRRRDRNSVNCTFHRMGTRVRGDHIHVNLMEDWLHELRVSHSNELLNGCWRDQLVNRGGTI